MFQKLARVIRTFRAHRADPEGIIAAVQSFDAVGELLGRGDGTMRRRMLESETGRHFLDERHDILAIVSNRDWLRTLPEGSLGREYLRFAEDRQFFPEDLAATVREARAATGGFVPNATPETAYLHDRFRDLHDIWHVVTGYDTDMGGEWGLIAFQSQQVAYRSMMVVAFTSCMRVALHGRLDLVRVWFEGRRRAKQAPFLLALDWEDWLLRPLDEVRHELCLDPPPTYRRFDYPESWKAAAA